MMASTDNLSPIPERRRRSVDRGEGGCGSGAKVKGRGKRKRDAGSMLLHQIFSGRHRNTLAILLPIASVVLTITLCIPVIMVGTFDKRSISQSLRKLKKGMSNIQIPRPTSRRTFAEGEVEMGVPKGDRLPSVASALKEPTPPGPLPPYSLENVLQTLPYFHDTFAVVIYDPPTDKFVAHYSNNMRWISGCHKLVTSVKALANSLRMMFPERFDPNNNVAEFALAMSSADYPGVHWNDCLLAGRNDCVQEELAPILQFGSTFRKPLLPSMVVMPMPQMNHLNCFHYWAMYQQVCEYYLPRTPTNPSGLVFAEHIGMEYDDLIPQVVWRGTDFSYLHKMEPNLRPPDFDMDVASQIDLSKGADRKTAATNALRQVYDELIPRWKGVVWTAEAEREAELRGAADNNDGGDRKKRAKKRQRKAQEATEQTILPWCNIKFAGAMYMGKKTPTLDIEAYRQFNEHGIPAAGEGMSLEELGRYKFHIDLGGGGGTTWSGTIEKLGLPGVLFHHVTPTKDYLHERLEPWVHYVPVREDLSDLKEKFEWATNHPDSAKRISDNASELARSWGTPGGFESMYKEFYEWPLRQVVEAYRPLEGGGWQEAVTQAVGEELRPIMSCGGYHHHDCERLTDDLDFTRLHDRDVNMSS